MPPILSSHTVDDAVITKNLFKEPNEYELFILTSDFHLECAELIFKEILKDYNLHFISAKSSLPHDKLNAKMDHEKKSVQAIIDEGLYY